MSLPVTLRFLGPFAPVRTALVRASLSPSYQGSGVGGILRSEPPVPTPSSMFKVWTGQEPGPELCPPEESGLKPGMWTGRGPRETWHLLRHTATDWSLWHLTTAKTPEPGGGISALGKGRGLFPGLCAAHGVCTCVCAMCLIYSWPVGFTWLHILFNHWHIFKDLSAWQHWPPDFCLW